ncbi:MAG TPA: hypothetical protein VK918_09630 [Pyrinomonadaceae bacterium]|nr:hypothetical protein [Pyrinomonadaceae bacterium]
MKTVFRSIGLGMMLAALFAVGSTTVSAQAACEDYDGNAALDAKIRENYGNDATLKVAIDAGKEYLTKYGSCEVFKDFSDWVKGNMPKWEEAQKRNEELLWLKPRAERFDMGIKTEKYAEAYAAGNEILAKYPDNLNFMVPLGMIGLYESYDKNFAFNDDTLKYARLALAKLKAGAAATKKNPAGQDVYGVFQFEMTKEDAISDLTYAQAYINYHAKGNKQEGLRYYYETSQLPGKNKENPLVYETIGSYYFDEVRKHADEVKKLIEEQKLAPEEEKLAKDQQIKAKIALLNGYAERALDAYGRAHRVTKSDAASKAYKDGLYNLIKQLYALRFEKETGIDAYIASTVQKPMPNPTSAVQPVTDPETDADSAAATTTGSTAMTRP